MDLRKLHNSSKREFINYVSKANDKVLDVGCGCGGDLQKWNYNSVVVTACDPDERSVCEARNRSKKFNINVNLYVGDISVTPVQAYDIICYNFSLQYTFATEELFMKTLMCIDARSKVGTKLVGVIPDSNYIMMLPEFSKDYLGSEIQRGDISGNFGDSVKFYIPDTPYYKTGPKSEPVAWKDLLITHLHRIGFINTMWYPLISFPTSTVSDCYIKFIFERI